MLWALLCWNSRGVKEMGWLQFSLLFSPRRPVESLCCSLCCTSEVFSRGSDIWDCSVGTLWYWLSSQWGKETQLTCKGRYGHSNTGWCWHGGVGRINLQDDVEQSLGLRDRPQAEEIWEPVWVEVCRAVRTSWIFLWDSVTAESVSSLGFTAFREGCFYGPSSWADVQQGMDSQWGRKSKASLGVLPGEERKGFQACGRRGWEKGYGDESYCVV